MESKIIYEIDLLELPSGSTYEDRYSGYLKIFEDIATNNADTVRVMNPPASWVPLLEYLNCEVTGPRVEFEHDSLVEALVGSSFSRTAVEVLCGFRPETTDALWKVDRQWMVAPNRTRQSENLKEFIVTTNGSFYRPEVLNYLDSVLPRYAPIKKKVVLCPCAADKPYPAKLHKAILDLLPEDYYLAVVTGVLGIVPQELWDQMPYYDSGLPNEWRLMTVVRDYFRRFKHERVVAYVDYYSLAVEQAVVQSNHFHKTIFVNDIRFYEDYLDLLEPGRLERLKHFVNLKEWVTIG